MLPIPEALALSTVCNMCLLNQLDQLEDGEGQAGCSHAVKKKKKKIQEEQRQRAIR